MTWRYALIPTPIGELEAWGEEETVCGLGFAGSARSTRIDPAWPRDDRAFARLREQLGAYFAGELTCFNLLLRPRGTRFQERVWAALRTIPYGATITYGNLAAEIGQPRAVRAVGLANGRNPISIVIPCHRVVGTDGSLTGYGGGLDRKRWLLAHEQAWRR